MDSVECAVLRLLRCAVGLNSPMMPLLLKRSLSHAIPAFVHALVILSFVKL